MIPARRQMSKQSSEEMKIEIHVLLLRDHIVFSADDRATLKEICPQINIKYEYYWIKCISCILIKHKGENSMSYANFITILFVSCNFTLKIWFFYISNNPDLAREGVRFLYILSMHSIHLYIAGSNVFKKEI